MVFSSFKFLLLFLPFFLASYYLVEDRYKNLCLFLYSLVFYAYGCIDNIHYLFILVLSLIVNYVIGLSISKYNKAKKWLLALAMLFNFGILYIFKYSRYNLILPIGISFYTFQIMSYVFDIYMGKMKVEKDFINLSTYIVMFPQLIAGPIVRYHDVKNEISSEKKIRKENVIEGVKIFAFGLASKVVIANQLSLVGIDVSSYGLESMTCLTAILDVVSYTLQIYFDFFGYSLMAIGLGKLIGITIMKNFDEPFKSLSATEFWRRWHISLGNWFRDYVYIPLGGNKSSLFATCTNLFIVFSLSGLWHGPTRNYIYWGMYFGILIIIERLFLLKYLEKYKIIGHIYFTIIILASFTIFKNENLQNVGLYFYKMVDFKNVTINSNFVVIFVKNLKAIILGILFITDVPKMIYDKIKKNKMLDFALVVMLFLLSIYLIYKGYNDPFMYFRF